MLDDQIDEKATIAKAKKYLKQYPRLKVIARTTSTLKSGWNVSDAQVKHGTPKNGQEDFLINRIAISQEVEKLEEAIDGLDQPYNMILKEKYIKRHKTDFALYVDLGMTEGTFYKALRVALLDFAYIFDNGALLVYKKISGS